MNLKEISADIVVHDSTEERVRDCHRAHVWFCDLDAEPPESSPLLSGEWERAMRLKSLPERRRYVAYCGFVRRILAPFAGADPAVLRFGDGLHGKPRLELPPDADGGLLATLDFNLSHSENILAMAVVFGGEIGIDIEVRHFDVDYMSVAGAHLTENECERLRALPAHEAAGAFYRLWTRHEALARVEGRGSALRPPFAAGAGSGWMLHSLECRVGGREVVGAVAWRPFDRPIGE